MPACSCTPVDLWSGGAYNPSMNVFRNRLCTVYEQIASNEILHRATHAPLSACYLWFLRSYQSQEGGCLHAAAVDSTLRLCAVCTQA